MIAVRSAVEQASETISRIGTTAMAAPEVAAAGAARGLGSWAFYFGGRCGVLGDVDEAVVQAACGFFPATSVGRAWPKARAAGPVAALSQAYAEALASWGRAALAPLTEPDADQLADLLGAVVAAADPAGLPLFAGWRALAAPADPRGRALHVLHVLRELRGGQHLVAVLAAGVRPLEAVVAGRYGPGNAKFFGWPAPWPDAEPLRERMRAVEEVTARLMAPCWAVLSDADVVRAAELLAAVDPARPATSDSPGAATPDVHPSERE